MKYWHLLNTKPCASITNLTMIITSNSCSSSDKHGKTWVVRGSCFGEHFFLRCGLFNVKSAFHKKPNHNSAGKRSISFFLFYHPGISGRGDKYLILQKWAPNSLTPHCSRCKMPFFMTCKNRQSGPKIYNITSHKTIYFPLASNSI